jgi:hypothetical protein
MILLLLVAYLIHYYAKNFKKSIYLRELEGRKESVGGGEERIKT